MVYGVQQGLVKSCYSLRVTTYGKINIVEYGFQNQPECGDERTHWLDYHERNLYPTKEELLKSL